MTIHPMFRGCIVAACLLGTIQSGLSATRYAIPGTSGGSGTQTDPYRGLAYGMSQLSGGDTLILSGGTFTLSDTVAIAKHNITLDGNGATGTNRTIITGDWVATDAVIRALPYGDKPLLRVENATNFKLFDVEMSGANRNIGEGVNLINFDGVEIRRSVFTNFKAPALRVTTVSNMVVAEVDFDSSGYEWVQWSLGMLQLRDVADSLFSDVTFYSPNQGKDPVVPEGGPGYGIKATGNYLKRLTFEHLDFDLDPYSPWGGGISPNFAVVIINMQLAEVVFRNSVFRNTSSLVNNSRHTEATAPYVLSYLDNVFPLKEMAYGVEMSSGYFEFVGNYAYADTGTSQYQFFKNFGLNTKTNIRIARNVFKDVSILFRLKNPMGNFEFVNNTVELRGSAIVMQRRDISVEGGFQGWDTSNWNIRNNAFDNKVATTGVIFDFQGAAPVPPQTKLTHNLINNMNVGVPTSSLTYQSNIFALPQFEASGARPSPYYMPASQSPLVDAGVNLGEAFLGSAPEIGAFEVIPNQASGGELNIVSATSATGTAANSIDGNSTTTWLGTAGSALDLDLGSSMTVNGLELQFPSVSGRSYSFQVHVSTTAAGSFTQVKSSSVNASGSFEALSLGAVSARRVRIVALGNNDSDPIKANLFHLKEVKLFGSGSGSGSSPVKINLTATSSTSTPGYAVDGSLSTNWVGNGGGTIDFDLGSTRSVSSISAAFPSVSGRIYSFGLYSSADASGSTFAYVGQVNVDASGALEPFSILGGINARRLRVVSLGNNDADPAKSGYFQLKEFEASGQ